MSLWEQAGIKPSGSWYIETGQGMGETLTIASQKQAYTLSDRGTFLATSNLQSKIEFEGSRGPAESLPRDRRRSRRHHQRRLRRGVLAVDPVRAGAADDRPLRCREVRSAAVLPRRAELRS